MKPGGFNPRRTKVFLYAHTLALSAAALMAVNPRAGAQFEFSASSSSSSILVSNAVTYTINVTNLAGGTYQINVTNTFPTTAQLLGASFTLNAGTGTTYTNSNGFSFTILPDNGAWAQMTVQAAPTQAGSFTNTVTMFVLGLTNFTTNLVVQATNSVPPQADLGVTIIAPAQAVITNDWMTYEVIAANSGPSAAANVVLTNARPPGVILRGVSPPNYSVAGSNMIFNLGTLTNGACTNLQFTIQPTNVGPLTLSASIGAPGVLDTNLANNSASAKIIVTNYLSGLLLAVTNSPQTYDMQNNLVEQGVLVTNQGSNDVPAVRVVVSGLASTNVLFNAVGTNNGNPFVVYGSSLAAGQSVELLLQYAANNYFPFANSQLQAFAVQPPDLSAPLAGTVSTNLNIISIVRLSSGSMLIWFTSVSNQTYTVAYSDPPFTNWLTAQPSVLAPTTFTEWIDYGPPGTLSHPTNTPTRLYSVFQNP